MFDIYDFVEKDRVSWEWVVKRLGGSFHVVARSASGVTVVSRRCLGFGRGVGLALGAVR